MFWNKKDKKENTSKGKAIEITDQNFEKLIKGSEKPVMLDFYADWCGPCKVLGPFVDELAGDYEGKAIVGKINVDKQRGLTEKFKVKSMPTLFFIKDDVIVDGHNGILPKPNMAKILDDLIAEK